MGSATTACHNNCSYCSWYHEIPKCWFAITCICLSPVPPTGQQMTEFTSMYSYMKIMSEGKAQSTGECEATNLAIF